MFKGHLTKLIVTHFTDKMGFNIAFAYGQRLICAFAAGANNRIFGKNRFSALRETIDISNNINVE